RAAAMRPIRLPPDSVNHTEPSFARASVVGPLPGLGSGNATGRPSVEVSRSLAPSHRCSADAAATATVIPRTHNHLRASIHTFPHPVLHARLCYISDLRVWLSDSGVGRPRVWPGNRTCRDARRKR